MKGIISGNMGAEAPQEPSGEAASAVEDEAELEDGGEDENDPGFLQALKFAMSALYENGAANNIAEQLRKSQDIPAALADVAYEIVSITDERTNGAMDEEFLMLFVTHVVEEIVDIARAAGVQISASDIGQAIKQMILRYLGEQGVDTRELHAAMDKFDTGSLNTIEGEGAEAGSQPPAKGAAQPQEGAQK